MLDSAQTLIMLMDMQSLPKVFSLYMMISGKMGKVGWVIERMLALPLKNLIQALLGQAELGDHSRAFVGISSSMNDKAKDSVFQLQGEASCVLGSKSLACKRLNKGIRCSLKKAHQMTKFRVVNTIRSRVLFGLRPIAFSFDWELDALDFL